MTTVEAPSVPETQPPQGSRKKRDKTAIRPMPHLRRRLILILVSALGIACFITSVSTYATLQNSLRSQIGSTLKETANRAANPNNSPSGHGFECLDKSNPKNPLYTPGQGAGTINLCVDHQGGYKFSGYLSADGSIKELSDKDRETLNSLRNTVNQDSQLTEVNLDVGKYMVKVSSPGPSSDALITGVPLGAMYQTLTMLSITMGIGSVAVMIGTGFLGSFVIRRTMKPLERVSGVATEVARLNLESDTIAPEVRVTPKDANPRTEVGSVGYALNQLLDNVSSALDVRERTEKQIRAFIADASHELRTPLAAIKGYSDMLRWTEPLSESGQSSLARIDSQTERMSRLVEDLLTLARLDEGREPKLEQVDLTELVLECTSDMQAAARTHEWHLNLPDEPVEVVADRSQIQRVILNLLSNARKHTDEGTRVTAGLSVDAARREAVVTVTDNGPGIAPEFLPKIFDRFTRADKARSGSDGTTGLGLAIVQAIVQAHGGSIQVQSQPGHTVFTVRLPLDARLQPAA